jgi:sulfite exporter TauE/SafE
MLGTQAFNAKGHLSICTGVTIEARRASDVDDDQVRRDVLRLLLHLCYYNSRMSARILIGGLLAVLPGERAVRGNPGGQCAVCKSCKGFICKVLR